MSWPKAFNLLLLAAMLTLGCSHESEHATAEREEKPIPVTIAPVEHRTVDRTIDIVGTLRGWEEVTVGAKRSGRILKVLHDIGDRLPPGEALVELETVDSGLALSQAEKRLVADLTMLGLKDLPSEDFDVAEVPSVISAKVTVERATQNLDRERQLTARNATTQQRLQDTEYDLRRAQADYEHAKLGARSTLANAFASKVALDQARQVQLDMVVRAPVPSHGPADLPRPAEYAVSKRSVAEGQMVREGDAVFQLIIDNPLRLVASVPERFIPDVKPGQQVRLEVASYPGKIFTGRVDRINPSVDSTSRTFQVEIGIPNDEHLLRPGSFCEGKVLTDHQELATIVPLEAVVRYAGVTKVFGVEKDHVREVRVAIGDQGKGWMQVSGEIPDDAQIITSGQTQLADGTKITIRQVTPDAPTDPAAEPPAKQPAATPSVSGAAG